MADFCRGSAEMICMANENERRRNPRFQVGDGAFAFINNIPFAILNVSQGGMKIQSVLFDEVPPDRMTLDIFLRNENFYLQDIPVHLVRFRKNYARTPFSSAQLRCFGIQFGELTEQQKTRIDYFISQAASIPT
ncbi:MAG: PilZ domain-containing protein [Thermodesulfobacteriota bacterium]